MKVQSVIAASLLLSLFPSEICLPRPLSACVFSLSDLNSGFSLTSSKSPKTSQEFFDLERGAVAIGRNCHDNNNLCEQYYVITNCPDVMFPFDRFNDTHTSIVFNTSRKCRGQGACPLQNGYLAATVVYRNNETSYSKLSKIEVIRNPGWHRPDYSFPTPNYRKELRTPIPRNRIAKFFELQTSVYSLPAQFDEQVVRYFHAKPFSGLARSWDHREVFGTAFSRLSRCEKAANRCSLKAYLEKFSETADGPPSNALRVSFALANAEGVDVKTFSPIGDDLYNFQTTIHFEWLTPLPSARPTSAASSAIGRQ